MSRALALGWKKDEPDDRDHDAMKVFLHAAPTVVPDTSDNADLSLIVDQLQEGSCTANGTGQAMRAAQLLEMVEIDLAKWIAAGNNPTLFDARASLATAQVSTEFWSRDFMYYLARAFDGTVKQDAGTNIRTIFQVANKFGFCNESAWPYLGNTDPSNGPVTFDKMPSAEAYREAYDQRASAQNVQAKVIDYARIMGSGQDRIDAIKLASSQRHMIVFGTLVTEKFCSDMTANGGNPISPPASTDKIAGGHAMCIGGYDASGAKIINSWSKQFGQQGWCKFSWDYIAWIETTDLWIVRRSPVIAQAKAAA